MFARVVPSEAAAAIRSWLPAFAVEVLENNLLTASPPHVLYGIVSVFLVLVHWILRYLHSGRARAAYSVARYVVELSEMTGRKRASSSSHRSRAERDEGESEQQEEETEVSGTRAGSSKKAGKGRASARSRSPARAAPKTTAADEARGESRAPLIVVAGGCGRIGSATVRSLLEASKASGNLQSCRVRVLDRRPPAIPWEDGAAVQMVQLDLITATDAKLLAAFAGADAVINCTGAVILYDDPVTIHNRIRYVTTRLLWAARRTPSCRAFVHSSTTIVLHDGRTSRNAIPFDAPYTSSPSSFYAKTHIATEKFVLECNDPTAGFFTCSNRFPSVYGWRDNLLISLLVDNEIGVFPSQAANTRIELVYLKNVGHAHTCAVRTLLSLRDSPARAAASRAAGRAQIITQSLEGETSPTIEFWERGRSILGIHRQFILLPTWFFKLIARYIEVLYYLSGGFVPNHLLWNLTSTLIGYCVHDNTYLGQKEAFHAIGYRPLYDNITSFEDMKRSKAAEDAQHAEDPTMAFIRRQFPSMTLPSRHASDSPIEDIDWTPAPMPESPWLLHSLAISLIGPGPSWTEIVMLLVSQLAGSVFGLWVAHRNGFTFTQTIVSIALGGWHGSGAMQTMSPTSKRWFHLGGKIGTFLLILIFTDAAVSMLLVTLFFETSPPGQGLNYWLLMVVTIHLGIWFLVGLVPLAHQRAWGVLYLEFIMGFVYLELYPVNVPGMDWVMPLTAFKMLVCHAPRHEPYAYDAERRV